MNLFDIFKTKETPQLPEEMQEEAGVSGDTVFDGFDGEVSRADKLKIKDYRNMRDTDATVDSLLNVVTLPILSATFGVKAAEDDENEEQAEFIRTCLFRQPYLGGMEVPFSLVLEQMLHAVMDGFEVFERVYRIDETGKIVLKKLALRDAETVKIRLDKAGGYDGIHQEASFGTRTVNVNIPARKTFLFTYGKADSQYYGRSAFKSLYGNYDKKRKLEYLDSISIQNSAVKPKVLVRTSNETITNAKDGKIKDVLRKIAKLGHLKPVASIPYGYDLKELQGGDNSRINESIERQNSEMARAFLATFTLLGSQGSSSVGSYALSSDQSDLFMIAIKGTMNLIVDHINQYWIADLIDLNYPVGKRHYPEFYFDDLTDDTITFLKGIFSKLIEKDKISDEIVAGIEEKIKSRFEIEPVERETPQDTATRNGEGNLPLTGQNADNSTSVEEELSGQQPDKTNAKEDDGNNAGKFRREMRVGEEKVKWGSLERQSEKVAEQFEAQATPVLEKFAEELSQNLDGEVKLPKNYLAVVEKTYRNVYNYGKLAASDEEGLKAPKTKENETENARNYLDYIEEKQVGKLKSLIAEAKLKRPEVHEATLGQTVLTSLKNWVTQTVDGMKHSIFGYGNNAGRAGAFAVFDETEKAVYMWSALAENTCAECENLDGSVVSSQEMQKSVYQPGTVHLNCNCIWVRMTGEDKPKATGFPDDIDELDYMMNATKATLQKDGIVEGDETKANAIRRLEFNNQNNGETLEEVETSIRGQDFETLAYFDASGKKLVDYTSNLPSSVGFSSQEMLDEFNKYLKDNKATVSVHNHPGGRPFSATDIQTGIREQLQEIRVVAENATYSLKPGKDGWPHEPLEVVEFYEAEQQKFFEQFRLLVNVGKFNSDLGVKGEWWIMDKAMESVAEKFNMVYNVNKVKELWKNL